MEVQESHGQRFIRSWCHIPLEQRGLQPTSHTSCTPELSLKEHFPRLLLELPHSNQLGREHKKGHRVVTEGRRNFACSTLIPRPLLCFVKLLLHKTSWPTCWASSYIFGHPQFLKSFVVQWLSHNPWCHQHWKNTGWP